MGLDAMVIVLRQEGRSATADLLEDIAWEVGRSVVLYGFHPQRGDIAKGLAWDGKGTPLTPSQLNDPSYAEWYGGYNRWAIPCLSATLRQARQRGDQQVKDRAEALLKAIVPAKPDLKHLRFMGVSTP